jgi:hypothetical protein
VIRPRSRRSLDQPELLQLVERNRADPFRAQKAVPVAKKALRYPTVPDGGQCAKLSGRQDHWGLRASTFLLGVTNRRARNLVHPIASQEKNAWAANPRAKHTIARKGDEWR